MNVLDAIGHFNRVAFEEVSVSGTGRIETFEVDVQVEVDCGDYVFLASRIYTHQDGPDGDGFYPAQTETSVQQGVELALREYVQSKDAYERLCELADDEGLRCYLMEAA